MIYPTLYLKKSLKILFIFILICISMFMTVLLSFWIYAWYEFQSPYGISSVIKKSAGNVMEPANPLLNSELNELSTLVDQNKFNEAYQLIQKHIKKYPNNPDLLIKALTLAELSGKDDKIIVKRIHDILKSNPKNKKILSSLIEKYETDGNFEKAIVFRKKLIPLINSNPEIKRQKTLNKLDSLQLNKNQKINEIQEKLNALRKKRKSLSHEKPKGYIKKILNSLKEDSALIKELKNIQEKSHDEYNAISSQL